MKEKTYEPKYKMIAAELISKIQTGFYPEAGRLPGEYALMHQFDVSRQTIRSALAILEEEGYIKTQCGSGSYVTNRKPIKKEGRSFTIAVITPYIDSTSFSRILSEIEETLTNNNCVMLLFATRNQVAKERSILEKVQDMDVDGIIVNGTRTAFPNPNLDIYQELQESNFPVVFINRCYPQLSAAISVQEDEEESTKNLVKYLVEKGHKHIAGVFKLDDAQSFGRYAGYMQGLLENGLMINDNLVAWYNTDQIFAAHSNQLAIHAITEWRNQGCTAIICDGEEGTFQILRCMHEAGIKNPAEMSVVSFEDCELASLIANIAAVAHGSGSIGRIAAEKVLKLISGEFVTSEKLPWRITG